MKFVTETTKPLLQADPMRNNSPTKDICVTLICDVQNDKKPDLCHFGNPQLSSLILQNFGKVENLIVNFVNLFFDIFRLLDVKVKGSVHSILCFHKKEYMYLYFMIHSTTTFTGLATF